jgi:hypothetical protein
MSPAQQAFFMPTDPLEREWFLQGGPMPMPRVVRQAAALASLLGQSHQSVIDVFTMVSGATISFRRISEPKLEPQALDPCAGLRRQHPSLAHAVPLLWPKALPPVRGPLYGFFQNHRLDLVALDYPVDAVIYSGAAAGGGKNFFIEMLERAQRQLVAAAGMPRASLIRVSSSPSPRLDRDWRSLVQQYQDDMRQDREARRERARQELLAYRPPLVPNPYSNPQGYILVDVPATSVGVMHPRRPYIPVTDSLADVAGIPRNDHDDLVDAISPREMRREYRRQALSRALGQHLTYNQTQPVVLEREGLPGPLLETGHKPELELMPLSAADWELDPDAVPAAERQVPQLLAFVELEESPGPVCPLLQGLQ